MALQYGLNNAIDFASSKLVSFASVLTRTAGQPMDKSSLWYPLDGKTGFERAQEYAASSSAYVGQELAVIDVEYEADETTVKTTSVKFYGIQDAQGTLKELGSSVLADNASIAVGEDGKIALYGFGEALEGALPQVKTVGSSKIINWVPISSIVEGDGNSVTTLTALDNSLEITESHDENFEGYKYSAKVKISKKEDNLLSLTEDGLYANTPATTDYTLTVSTESPEDTIAKHYVFTQNGQQVAHIDIPKDMVIQSGEVVTATEADKSNDSSVVVGETYIRMTIVNQEKPIYIAAKDLVDIYTGEASATATVTISADNKISTAVKISAESGNSLVAKDDGLYVNAPSVPDITIEAGENTPVPTADTVPVIGALTASGHTITTKSIDVATAAYVDKKVGEIVIPDIPVITVAKQKALEDSVEDSVVAVVGLEADEHTITPSTQKVASSAGLAALKDAINGTGGIAERLAALENNQTKTITDIVTGSDDDQLGIEAGAQVNKIESIVMPDQKLDITEKSVSIPLATADKAGVVKTSTTVNTISFAEGIGTINGLSTDKLVQGKMTLVLDGGSV